MGNPRSRDEAVLTQAAVRGSEKIAHEAALMPIGNSDELSFSTIMVDGIPYGYHLAPYELDTRIVWAVKKAFARELSEKRLRGLADALDELDEGKAKFLAGAAVGAGKAVQEVVESYIRSFRTIVGGLIQYYRFAFDLEVWDLAWTIWRSEPGSTEGWKEMASYLANNYPGLWTAITLGPKLESALRAFAAKVEDAIANIFTTLAEGLVDILQDAPEGRSKIDQFISMRGQPYDQGVLLGSTVGVATLQVVLAAADLQGIVRALLRLGRRLLVGKLKDRNLVSAIKGVIPEAEDVSNVGKAVKQIELEARQIYQELATEILPYHQLERRTGDFNQHVAATLVFRKQGAELGPETEYVGLRLDADHILEDRTYSWFGSQFKQIGWQSPKQMDAFAVHTEAHIRTGTSLADEFQLGDSVVNRVKSLTDLKRKFIGDDPKRYPDLLSLVDAYENFYQNHASQYYPRLSDWFVDIRRRIKDAGL